MGLVMPSGAGEGGCADRGIAGRWEGARLVVVWVPVWWCGMAQGPAGLPWEPALCSNALWLQVVSPNA